MQPCVGRLNGSCIVPFGCIGCIEHLANVYVATSLLTVSAAAAAIFAKFGIGVENKKYCESWDELVI